MLLIQEKLGHAIKPRALITMFDLRTRYSKQVLAKVKERFQANVFESVIRYNIRLRETVDYGLPIGEYDKHSIGYKDYDNLAQEVIDAETVNPYDERDALITAKDILANTEKYIDSVAESSDNEESVVETPENVVSTKNEDPVTETDETSPAVMRSSYQEMIETLAVQATNEPSGDPIKT